MATVMIITSVGSVMIGFEHGLMGAPVGISIIASKILGFSALLDCEGPDFKLGDN